MTVSDVNQGLSLGALSAWLVGVQPEVVIGSLAGAVIFVTFATEFPIKRRLLLAVVSFFCGLVIYKPTAIILIGCHLLTVHQLSQALSLQWVSDNLAAWCQPPAANYGIWQRDTAHGDPVVRISHTPPRDIRSRYSPSAGCGYLL